jgi:hypothetical protein
MVMLAQRFPGWTLRKWERLCHPCHLTLSRLF